MEFHLVGGLNVEPLKIGFSGQQASLLAKRQGPEQRTIKCRVYIVFNRYC